MLLILSDNNGSVDISGIQSVCVAYISHRFAVFFCLIFQSVSGYVIVLILRSEKHLSKQIFLCKGKLTLASCFNRWYGEVFKQGSAKVIILVDQMLRWESKCLFGLDQSRRQGNLDRLMPYYQSHCSMIIRTHRTRSHNRMYQLDSHSAQNS